MTIVRKKRAEADGGVEAPVRVAPARKASAKRAQDQGDSAEGKGVAANGASSPATPGTTGGKSAGSRQRKRLAKAFPRPLDKVLKKKAEKSAKRAKEPTVVRDRFTFGEAEYAALVGVKKKLAEQGVAAKKSELVRVGVGLLSSLSAQKIKSLLAKLQPLD